jgi:cell division protein FtsZ
MEPVILNSSGRAFSMRVLGVGGAGCNAVAHLASQPLEGVQFAVLNTDAAALEHCTGPHRLLIGGRTMRGLGAGGDPERGRVAAEEDAGIIRQLCEGADLVFVVAGLGGGTGTGAAPVVARIAREAGALVLGIVVLPFDCEGAPRHARAAKGLHQLKTVADAVIAIPNQKLLRLIDEKTSLVEAFKLTNDLVAQGVCGIWRMLSRPGLINVDFADLCAVIRGRHAEGSLASTEARGENRTAQALEKLLAHPLIEGGSQLAGAGQMLVCIVGGPDLAMRDVNHIVEQIRRNAEHAHLVMGASIEEGFRDRIAITLVASFPNGRGATESPEEAPEEEPLLRDARLEEPTRVVPRFVAPPPETTPEMIQQMSSQAPRGRRRPSYKQGMLNLEIVSRGRFGKSEPTIHRGQDLDIPTFVRRGIVLN